ncbi:hatching enzyme 1.2-like [Erpetoichthys calabaricus]|uniref:hatching enzyme 1.2-like n=1 Tax=Erpetoichthys calabaricus TaxID=27687 RepID=UPI002234D95A|nr:hatching enzyme 1.2-like [Erpetoichthys calabaricus]
MNYFAVPFLLLLGFLHGMPIIQDSLLEKGNREIRSVPDSPDVFTRIIDSNKDILNLLIEGDIWTKNTRNAIICKNASCFWPMSSNGVVYIPFTLDRSYSPLDKITITGAMTDFYSKACIQFIPWTNQKDYVSIEPQNGCWSSVGKVGGKQVVSLQRDTCLFNGVIQHELNHVLGFLHEQSRSDRDQHVRIDWQYISPEYVNNFQKINTNNLGTPYDYTSVMHYPRDAFSNTTNEYTITPIPNPNVTIGQRIGLSSIDIQRINLLYQCNNLDAEINAP